MKRPSMISVGEVLWDLFPDGERFGGAPANFACHAAIQGADVAIFSAVGNDTHGASAKSILTGYGIDVSLMQTDYDAATGTVTIELDHQGKPTFTIHPGSAWDRLKWNDQLAARIATADAIYFGTLGQRTAESRATIRQAINVASAAGVARILDINLRPPFEDSDIIRESIQLASILKLSDDELAEVCRACGLQNVDRPQAALRGLLKFGNLDLVVLTRGEKGALLVTDDAHASHDGFPVNVIDTVGAGDSFAAAFTIGHLQGMPHEQNLQNACKIAAACCAHSGAIPVAKH